MMNSIFSWKGSAAFIKFFKNGISPASFQFIFVFSSKCYNFYNKLMLKNVHPVYGAGIQTHDETIIHKIYT